MHTSVDTQPTTNHVPTEGMLRPESFSVLPLIQKVSDVLATENITYCHCKGNDVLERSASRDNDLDLIVNRADVPRFTELLHRLGFKQAKAPAKEQNAWCSGLLRL